MLKQLLRFETFYQLRQRAFLWLSLLFLGFGFLMGKQGATRGNVLFNASYAISHIVALFTLGSVFIIMFFTVSGVLRDKQYQTERLIFSTSLSKPQFFISRFLGIFISSLVTFSMFLIGFYISTLLPDIDPERKALFNMQYYLQAWGIIIVPNIFICSAIIFSVGILSGNTLATYVSAIFIYVLYFICSLFLNSPLIAQSVPASPEGMVIAALSDPFGISAFFEQTQYWTPFQKNTEMISFSGYFMWNRLIWLVIALGVFVTTYRFFSFRIKNQNVKKAPGKGITNNNTVYRQVAVRTDQRKPVSVYLSLLSIELRGVFRSLSFMAVLLCWIVIGVSEIYSRFYRGGEYNDSLYPAAGLLVERIHQPLFILSLILIVFFGGELFWKARGFNFNSIIDTTPTSNGVFYLAKISALICLPMLLTITGIIIGVVFQWVLGYDDLEPRVYLSLLLYQFITTFIYSALTLFIQNLIHHKYIGMTITGILIIVLGTSMSEVVGIVHPLFRFGYIPFPGYTSMNGYSDAISMIRHLAGYWMSFAFVLAMITYKLWKRGRVKSLDHRWKHLLSGWNKMNTAVFLILCVASLGYGSIIFYNKNIVNPYQTVSGYLDRSQLYEQKYKKYDTLPQLFPVAISTSMDIYPKERRYRVRVNNTLRNRDHRKATFIFISEKEKLDSITLENAVLKERDSVLGTYLFEFCNPVLPGESVRFSYEIDQQQSGYEFTNAIVANGSYIRHNDFNPVLGYRNSLEIQDRFERKKRGLPELNDAEESDEHIFSESSGFGKIDYETVISTSDDQTAIGSGDLLEKWSENGRSYFKYKATDKILPNVGYFSANYKVRTDRFKDVKITQYYHEPHYFNIDTIQIAAKKALEYCISNFGDYGFDHLRIAEVPGHWSMGGYAHPGTISMVEDRLYLTDIRNENDFNLVVKRTIHEVSHQWWGHLLTPKLVPGGALLVEGFAKYTEAVVMEKLYGKKALWKLSDNAIRRYFTGRSYALSEEPPLYRVEGESYLSYGKAFTVLYAIKELIGEERVNLALRRTIGKHQNEEIFTATADDFIDELYKVTPATYHSLVDDWFKRVITYDLRVENVKSKELKDGRYEIELQLVSKRFKTLEGGQEVQVGMDEPVQIGLFSTHPEDMETKSGKEIIYLKAHQLSEDKTTIRMIVDEEPVYVAVDPFGTRLDANRADNIK